MKNKDIKIFANMVTLLPKIEIKESYSEEEYSAIYHLIDGYSKLKKYFSNAALIDKLLNIEVKGHSIGSLLKTVRNRTSHIEKNDAITQLIILQSEVKKDDINSIINNIKSEIDVIFKNYLNNDSFRLIMNTREMDNIFGAMNYSLYIKEPNNKFDEYVRNELGKIMSNFEHSNSSFEDYEKVVKEIVEFFQKEKVKNGTSSIYGEDIYNGILRMMTDDNFTEEEIVELLSRLKNI